MRSIQGPESNAGHGISAKRAGQDICIAEGSSSTNCHQGIPVTPEVLDNNAFKERGPVRANRATYERRLVRKMHSIDGAPSVPLTCTSDCDGLCVGTESTTTCDAPENTHISGVQMLHSFALQRTPQVHIVEKTGKNKRPRKFHLQVLGELIRTKDFTD